MKFGKCRWINLGWVACFILACTEKPEGSDAALYGVGDLVSSGDLIFTLSRDHNELRALDLNSSDRVRGPHFMPAVNPLEPLAIPVLDYPNILASDLRWEDSLLDSGELIPQGRMLGGPFVYAASHGRGGISIIGASREWLKELQRFPTGAPVTALAAHRAEGLSTLFFGTYDGAEGSLWALDLQSEQAVHEASVEDLLASQRLIQSYTGRVITALSILPGGALAVAVRRDVGSATAVDETTALHFLDNTEPMTERLKLELPQALRMLTTHAAAKHTGGSLAAGKWLYGILDEGGCMSDLCESGMLAVDVETGDIGPTLPCIGGLPISLGFMPAVYKGVERLVGFYVTGSGLIGMFDAAAPGPLEAPRAVSAAFFTPDGAGELRETSYVEGPLLNADGTPAVQVTGVVLDETILIGIESLVPGWTRVTLEADTVIAGRFFVDSVEMSRIEEGDELELLGQESCVVRVEGVDEGDGAVDLGLGPLPACFGEGTDFQLRAGEESSHPYVVAGMKTGYLGRTGPGQSFHSAKPELSIDFGTTSSVEARRGARWELALSSGYFEHSRDIQGVSECSTRIAAGIWIDSVRQKAYISFSSSNALVEVGAQALLEKALGEAEVACYR
ncbi:MAG: hypothetical protein FWD46_00110 [Cystobacterineae bacterium]|nr:hypothetical protein [Cystobacterineae bacterium]